MSFLARRRDRPQPSASGRRNFAAVQVPNNVETVVGTINGFGYCEWIQTETDHDAFRIYVYCDGVLAFQSPPLSYLSATMGYAGTTPAIQLPKYTAGGYCCFQLTLRFEFRGSIQFRALQNSGVQRAITLESLINLM